jgi:hypothetical protein
VKLAALGPTQTKHTKKINPKKIAADFASCPADEWSEIAFGNGFLQRQNGAVKRLICRY